MRLIDVDELKINLYHNKKVVLNDDLVKCIDDTKTAYSVDKVVEELECDRCESCSLLEVCAGSICCGKCHEKIIEIVKQGGLSESEQKLNEMETNND